MSKRVPRWTPPIPPVPMNLIPAERHTARVPPTVVAPVAPRATQTPSSLGPAFRADESNRSSSLSVSPTRISPSSTPIVAGTAPAARTRRSLSSPTAAPSPGGKPCATIVVSSATTASASRTSSEIRITASSRGWRRSARLPPSRARRRRPGSRRRARRPRRSCRARRPARAGGHARRSTRRAGRAS